MLNLRKTLPFIALGLGLLTAPAFALAQPPAVQQNYAATQLEMRLSAVEEQMRGLTGKVEQVDYMLRRIDQVLQRMQEDSELRFSELEKGTRQQVSVPAKSPPLVQQQQAPVTGTLGSVSVRGNQVTGGSVAPKAPALPDTPADYGLTAQEQYDRAFGLLRQADYDSAEVAFNNFFEKNAKHKLVSNAKYWYAETFYVRGKYGKAAVAFAEAYQHATKGPKAPDSLLKLAMALGALDKKKDACGALTALKMKHPKAAKSIRKRAAQERRRLRCK